MHPRRRWLILIGILTIITLLYFNFTRQLIKMTVLFALPAVMLYLLGARLPKKSIGRTIIAAIMLLIVVVYGFQLSKLPVKAKVWHLNEEGAALVAAQRYDEARQVYQQIGELGDQNTMQRKLVLVNEQEGYASKLDEARKLASAGNNEKAMAMLKEIPATAGCYREARQLLKKLR
ncbi:MAG: hypothetical protein ACM3NT_08220 [Methylocystaceae bacterium]